MDLRKRWTRLRQLRFPQIARFSGIVPALSQFSKMNWREWVEHARTRSEQFATAKRLEWAGKLKELKAMQPSEVWERLGRLAIESRPADQRRRLIRRFAWIAFLAYVLADTFSLFTEELVPDPPVVSQYIRPRVPSEGQLEGQNAGLVKYKDIVGRNIFSSSGTIPDEDISSGIAQRTRLPFSLIGVLLFEDPAKSIATIEDTSMGRIFPVQAGDSILDKAQIEKIEEFKVVFTNKDTGNLEYVEMPHKELQLPIITEVNPGRLSAVKKNSDGITQLDDNHFQVERNAIDKSMANLSDVLQQAKAIPNFENGNLNGYKILQVIPGSIFEQLGIRNGDVVTSVNGTAVTDQGKALQMLNDLRNQQSVSIAVKRGGSPVTLNYSLR